jgi:hypothetical protein
LEARAIHYIIHDQYRLWYTLWSCRTLKQQALAESRHLYSGQVRGPVVIVPAVSI